MTAKQSSLVVTHCQVFSIENEKLAEIAASENWSLLQQGGSLYLHDGDVFNVEFSKELVKIKYKESQAFFLKNGNIYFALLLPIPHEQIDVIEYKMQQNNVRVIEWETADQKTQDQLKKNCGKKIGDQFPYKNAKKGTSLGYKIGGFFGALNTLVAKPTKKINDVALNKVQDIKQEKLSEETKSNWNRFKEKAKELNHGAAEAIQPARKALGGITDKIGQKFQTSENFLIKGVRNFGNKLKDSLNEGYRNSMRPNEDEELKEQVEIKQEKTPESNRYLS